MVHAKWIKNYSQKTGKWEVIMQQVCDFCAVPGRISFFNHTFTQLKIQQKPLINSLDGTKMMELINAE